MPLQRHSTTPLQRIRRPEFKAHVHPMKQNAKVLTLTESTLRCRVEYMQRLFSRPLAPATLSVHAAEAG